MERTACLTNWKKGRGVATEIWRRQALRIGRIRMGIKFILVSLTVLLSGCGTCDRNVVDESASGNNRFVTTVVYQSCGATTRDFTLVEIRSRYRWFGLDKTVVFSAKNEHDVQLTWTGPNRLVINCMSCSKRHDVNYKTQWKDTEIQVVFGQLADS